MRKMIGKVGHSQNMGKMDAAAVGLSAPYAPVLTYDHNSASSFPAQPAFVEDPISGLPRLLGPRTRVVASQPIGTAGVELSLGRALDALRPNDWCFAKMSIDGSKLAHWVDPAFPTGGPQMLLQMRTFFQAQETAMAAALEGTILNICEADALDAAAAAAYLANLRIIRDFIRATWPASFIAMYRCPTALGSSSSLVIAAQNAFVAETSRAGLIDVNTVPLRDATHWTDAGYEEVGRVRYPALIRTMMPSLNTTPFNIRIGAGSGDTTPPVIVIVSPTPGVPPGNPGGFSADWQVARMTPVIVRITDIAPGNLYQCLSLTYAGAVSEIDVYRRGAFRGEFAGAQSTMVQINATTIELTFRPITGWPNSAGLVSFVLNLDVVDAAGNIAS